MAYASARSDVDLDIRPRLGRRWGGPVAEIRPDDMVWISPGENYRHGATPLMAMPHIVIQEALNESPVEWTVEVSDEQSRA